MTAEVTMKKGSTENGLLFLVMRNGCVFLLGKIKEKKARHTKKYKEVQKRGKLCHSLSRPIPLIYPFDFSVLAGMQKLQRLATSARGAENK